MIIGPSRSLFLSLAPTSLMSSSASPPWSRAGLPYERRVAMLPFFLFVFLSCMVCKTDAHFAAWHKGALSNVALSSISFSNP